MAFSIYPLSDFDKDFLKNKKISLLKRCKNNKESKITI